MLPLLAQPSGCVQKLLDLAYSFISQSKVTCFEIAAQELKFIKLANKTTPPLSMRASFLGKCDVTCGLGCSSSDDKSMLAKTTQS